MRVLGINALFHDPAAALVVDGRIVAAAEEERFSRRKHGKRPVPFSAWELPESSARWCLAQAGLGPADLDAVAYAYDPALARPADRMGLNDPWDHLRQEYARRAPDFLAEALPGLSPDQVRFVPHHVAHAASAGPASPYPDCAVLVLDGRGECASHLAGRYTGRADLEVLRAQELPDSLGLFYEDLTQHLGFLRSSDEFKVMALASYGTPRFAGRLGEYVYADGDGGFRARPVPWPDLAPAREAGAPWTRDHADLAASAQLCLEEVLLGLARWLHDRTGEPTLTMAGGVALNCVANTRLYRETPYRNVWVQPAAGDAGTALGAALHVAHEALRGRGRTGRMPGGPAPGERLAGGSAPTGRMPSEPIRTEPVAGEPLTGERMAGGSAPGERTRSEWAPTGRMPSESMRTEPLPGERMPREPSRTEGMPTEPIRTEPMPREPVSTERTPGERTPGEPIAAQPIPSEPMLTAALGRGWSDEELRDWLERAHLPYEEPADIAETVADELARDGVVAWFQGRAEFGPRALGHRSLLAHPGRAENLERLNAVKGREEFRPVAPMVLAERAAALFDGPLPSPYMLFVHDVHDAWRDRIPAVVHVDGTARIQTVDAATEPLVARMLAAFERRTGLPVVVNTSLNTAGRPMVDDPRDALECFGSAPVDLLALGPFAVRRTKAFS